MRYYEDLPVGRVDPGTRTYLVTEDEIMEMGRRWDPQPFHVDRDAAAASAFGGLVAATIHLFGIVSHLGMGEYPTAAVSALGFTNMVNHAPARPGDELHVDAEVVGARLSNSRPGVGIVSFRCTLINQRDEQVFSYENTCMVACRP